jgi:hypothetical protein
MMKLIPLTALALGLSSGVALADRHGGDHRSFGGDHRAAVIEHRAPAEVRDHRGGNVVFRGGGNVVVRGGGDWHRGGVVVRDGWHGGGRVFVNRGYSRPYYHNVVRRPIFVNRPFIGVHYYNYYRRPALIVENFAPMAGYYWVPGHWSWDGYEWQWQPGHYQPDPNYVDSGYYDDNY